MINWKLGRLLLYIILGAVVLFNSGAMSIMDWSLQTEILKGITVQLVLAVAAGLGIWILKYRL